ncbi:PREDICTED: uncharacterized protein LOC109235901 [Nicotiana attenuata]|uniref:uncharacterized protein LOC109235901 n=1 Tax=Nicotiana attenuata TaxID=49451 RepID=UPI0009056A8E|nr:PREDICTED: uncharacterized protein LOC109235901 [Nicotiana attenuata]
MTTTEIELQRNYLCRSQIQTQSEIELELSSIREFYSASLRINLLLIAGLLEMVLIDIIFNYGGDWVTQFEVLYTKKLIDGDVGIRQLLGLICDEYNVISIYAVDEYEPPIHGIPDIVHHKESYTHEDEAGTDYILSDLESDSISELESYDSEELKTLKVQKKREITEELNEYKELYKGMNFKDVPEARKCMKLYALTNKKKLELLKSGKIRLRYKCDIFGCPFLCLISKERNGGVKIKTLNTEHSCGVSYDNNTDNPKYKVKEMMADLKRVFELNISHGKCKRAKRMLLENLDGSFNDEYNKFEAYATELRDSNPGSDVVINLSKNAFEEGRRRFLRMYLLSSFKDGFQARLLQYSLDLKDGEGITFMSDMQKGLIDAVRTVLPQSQHRYCVRHIEANWCKIYNTGESKKLLWWCAWSTYEEEFKDQLKNLGELNKDAATGLLRYPPQTWCRAYLDTVCKNQSVDNNLTESFNKWILEARHKPIIKMLEDIRIKVMNMLREHGDEVRSWRHDFSPKTMELYSEYMQIAQSAYRVNANGENGYEVSEGGDKHCVNMAVKKCTCRQWDLTGIPCPHVIKAVLHNMGDPLTEKNWWYSKEAFLLTYKHKLQPLRGEFFWKIDPSQVMEPPELVKLAGRPKVK